MTEIQNKSILVTGGCGSVGSQILDSLLEMDPEFIRAADNSEADVASMQNHYSEHSNVEFNLLNIRDETQLRRATDGIDIIFHAAALKQVPLVEQNPYEAIKTNIIGTKNVIDAAIYNDVDRLLAISTDKAASPFSTMGATKLVAERLITSNGSSKETDLDLGSVRFGNVLGTSGSVVPIFYDQIRNGGPLTVTDPEMTRFIMTPTDAAQFAINSSLRINKGEVYVKKMPSVQIGVLAETMRNHFAPSFGYNPQNVEIDIVGPRKSERYHEKLVSKDEMKYADEKEDHFVLDIHRQNFDSGVADVEYTSKDAERLGEKELINKLEGVTS